MLLVVTLQSVGEDSRPDKSVYDKLSMEDMLLLPALHQCKFVRLGVRFWLCGVAGFGKVSYVEHLLLTLLLK